MTAEYKPYTWIENKGITKTVLEQNGHQIKNKINWDMNYDGKKAHINFDMDDNGKHKNLEMNLDNNDIMKILELGSNPNSLDKRLENDFIKKDYEYEPDSVPLFFSNDDNAMNELYNLDKFDTESESPAKPQIIQIQIPIQKRIIKKAIKKTIKNTTIKKPNLITRRYKTPSPKTMRIHLTKSSVARGLKKTKTNQLLRLSPPEFSRSPAPFAAPKASARSKTRKNKKTTRRGPLRRFLRNLI